MASPSPVRSRERLDRRAKLTVSLLFGAWLIDYVDRLVINLALPSIGKEFDLTRTEQGLTVSVFFLAYALCQIPGGMLADRFGAKRVTCWALLIWSVFTAMTGLAGSFAILLVVRFLFGAAEGIFPGASMKAITERTTPGQRMSANGIVQSSNAVGAVLAPLVAAPLIIQFGWRSAFFTVAAVGVFVYAAVQLWLPETDRSAEGPVPVRAGAAARVVLRSPAMWAFAGMFFGYDIIVWGLNTWVPSYLSEERGISLTSAGALVVFPAVAAAAAIVVGGRLADRLQGRQRLVVVPAMVVASIALVLMATASTTPTFVLWMTVATTSSSLSYMPVYAVPLRSLPAELTGVGAGMITFGGQLAGVVAPTAMGALADRAGFGAAFGFLVVGAVLAAVLAVTTPQDTDSFRRALRLPDAPAGDTHRVPAESAALMAPVGSTVTEDPMDPRGTVETESEKA